jgi:hypothetical protein
VRSGRLTWWQHDVLCEVDHCWNVRPDGTVVDSTWQPGDGAEGITYTDAE